MDRFSHRYRQLDGAHSGFLRLLYQLSYGPELAAGSRANGAQSG